MSLFQKFAENGFADFKGLSISGKIPVKQELINAVIGDFLSSTRTTPGGSASGFDPKVFLELVKKAEISADAGVLTLQIELRVD